MVILLVSCFVLFVVLAVGAKKVLDKSPKAFAVGCSILFVALAVSIQTNAVQRVLDYHLYDSKNHYLPCRKLPTEAEVRAVVKAQQQLIQQIEQVNPDGQNIWVEQKPECPEKADILIDYPGHQNRLEIEKLIDGDTFHGVPYRLRNY